MASRNRFKPLWIFFDLETTGLSVTHDRIIEIGAVAVGPSQAVLSKPKFSSLVKTEYPISPGASQVHHLCHADLADQEYFSNVFQKFIDWITSTKTAINKLKGFYCPVLVAHNGFQFDFPCLFSEMSRAGLDCDILRDHNIHFADTLQHLRQLKKSGTYRTLQGCGLSINALYKTYFPHSQFEGHRALADAEYTRDLIMDTELRSSLPTFEINSVDEMQRIVGDKKIRSDLRWHFGVEPWQVNRLRDLGLTYERLQDLFEMCNQDSELFKMTLEERGVHSEILRERIAGKLLISVMTEE